MKPFMMASPAVTLSEHCPNEMRLEVGKGELVQQTRSVDCTNHSTQLISDILRAETAGDLPWEPPAGAWRR